MLQVNQIIEIDAKTFRVLWSGPHITVWIDIYDAGAFPFRQEIDELESLLASGDAEVLEDPFLEQTMTIVAAGSKAEAVRDRGWDIIGSIIGNPDVFDRDTRGSLILEVVENKKTTKQTIYRLLRRYWQRGLTKNALLPDYHKSGARGKKRIVRQKLGRPRTIMEGTGCLVTPDVERLFRISMEKVFLTEKQTSLRATHRNLIGLYKANFGITLPEELPTFRQFEYFYEREYRKSEVTKSRASNVNYDKDIRPLHGTSTAEVLGPGSRFQIDATIADIYLVSAMDKTKIVGRPVVYFIIDVFSRLVVGMYVGFEGPSYASAMLALANSVQDKVSYCKKLGVEIEERQWPSAGLADAVLADRGELLGSQIEALIERFNVRIENTAAYRGDAKGIVERYFRTIQEQFKPYVEGIVTGRIGKKRAGNDYRLDAVLTIEKFTEVILHGVLWHNQFRSLDQYDRDADMPDDMPSVPLLLWNWGLENRTGRLRSFPSDLVSISLLPQRSATVSNLGINIFGTFYTCQEALAEGWFERSNSNRPAKIKVAYDPRLVDQIFLFPDERKPAYWVCDLATRSRQYRGLSFWELWQKQRAQRKSQAKARVIADSTQADLEEKIAQIGKDAESLKPKTGISKMARIGEIRDNRHIEKQRERARTAINVPRQTQAKPAEVIPLKTEKPQPDYKFPDMLDTLFGEDQDDE